ncbi:hypothetical protein AVEN_241628-1 [Araneus ventricosus]|uniref:RNase H type-1 domain-containing protein n=1 Tax=Araneus ventricosus TaxID=182803 RepID=A0A4Y2PDJ8_ARAVE|nr:hypothetical protein AVEN_241628-1 [Araneus ventricosus]
MGRHSRWFISTTTDIVKHHGGHLEEGMGWEETTSRSHTFIQACGKNCSFASTQLVREFCVSAHRSLLRHQNVFIEAGLEAILNENNYRAVWIVSDSRSSIQHLKDWNNVGDRTSISILKLLRHIGVDHEVHLQWIPSHVDIYGNEVADNLAKQGTAEPLCSAPSLTFDEIYSIRKNKDLKTWRVPPSHDWYKRSSPGGSIGLSCDRADQTALSRFVSGHLRSCSFSHGNKVFPVCAKCGVASASPEHILSCLRLSRETFETDPLLALDFLRVSGLMDGV